MITLIVVVAILLYVYVGMVAGITQVNINRKICANKRLACSRYSCAHEFGAAVGLVWPLYFLGVLMWKICPELKTAQAYRYEQGAAELKAEHDREFREAFERGDDVQKLIERQNRALKALDN